MVTQQLPMRTRVDSVLAVLAMGGRQVPTVYVHRVLCPVCRVRRKGVTEARPLMMVTMAAVRVTKVRRGRHVRVHYYGPVPKHLRKGGKGPCPTSGLAHRWHADYPWGRTW